jgi:hypothetical protein
VKVYLVKYISLPLSFKHTSPVMVALKLREKLQKPAKSKKKLA